MELTVFHSLDEMLNQKGKFDGFMAIGANVIAESDLEKLHEVMPYGVFIDVNPAPNLFDSVQPTYSRPCMTRSKHVRRLA